MSTQPLVSRSAAKGSNGSESASRVIGIARLEKTLNIVASSLTIFPTLLFSSLLFMVAIEECNNTEGGKAALYIMFSMSYATNILIGPKSPRRNHGSVWGYNRTFACACWAGYTFLVMYFLWVHHWPGFSRNSCVYSFYHTGFAAISGMCFIGVFHAVLVVLWKVRKASRAPQMVVSPLWNHGMDLDSENMNRCHV